MRFSKACPLWIIPKEKVPHFKSKEAQSELSVALSLSLASCSPAELASVWLNTAIFKIICYIYNLSKKLATYWFTGWNGFSYGAHQFTVGYTLERGVGFSYRVTTTTGITVAKDFHTVNGVFKYHYHLYQPGIWTGGHLSPKILKGYGIGFNDLKIALPSNGYKKTELWRALEKAKY
jgi:hypothetical protein